ncbi:MAG: hypothetical protein AAFP19_09190 [Bacteroidota bacterium]
MSPFVLLLLSILLFTAAAAGGLYLLYYVLVNFQPGTAKIEADLKKMKAEIEPWVAELVPWQEEELELLSLNQTNKLIKKGVVTTAKGIFTSIYHEPLIAYAYKKYVSTAGTIILYARTSHHEFIYQKKKNEVRIMIDDEPVGILKQGHSLYSAQSNRLIARLGDEADSGLLPVLVGDKEVANLNQQVGVTPVSTRAFQLVQEKMTDKEEAVLLSLSVLNLVERELRNS